MDFEWDEGNRIKCQKHGVPIEEIEALLRGEPRMAPDPLHSAGEDRLIAVGRNDAGRPMFVAFTLRQHGTLLRIRVISARYMHVKEVKRYEKPDSS